MLQRGQINRAAHDRARRSHCRPTIAPDPRLLKHQLREAIAIVFLMRRSSGTGSELDKRAVDG